MTYIRICESCARPAMLFCQSHQLFLCEDCANLHADIEQAITGPLPKCRYISLALYELTVNELLNPRYGEST